jgi:choline-sulfatase
VAGRAGRAGKAGRGGRGEHRTATWLVLAGLVAAGLAVALFAWRSTRASHPNILLITLDTTRADHLGAYGYRAAATPRLDRLAGDGVLFERAMAAAPITLPAHASLLTGLYPFAHGVRNNGNFSLDAAIPTLATALHDAGYRTGAFVSAFILDRRYGLSRGFDVYDDRVRLERRGDATAAAALEWLRDARRASLSGKRTGAPFFLWLHLYDPHDPYAPPEPFRARFAQHPYDGEIAFDDTVLATVLERLQADGVLASTIVAVAGDHGESLGEHDEATHALFVYDATLRVPLIMSWPGHLPAGARVADLVRGIDLTPTLLDLAGIAPLPGAHGRSLASIARGRGASDHPIAYAETYFPQFYMNWSPLRAIRDGQWKYIEAPRPELYDLARDPGETTNLASQEPGRAEELRRALDAASGGGPGRMSERRMDAEAAAKLAALGYVGGGVRQRSDARTRPDPKEMTGVFNALREANAAIEQHRPAEAVTMARAALDRDPSNAFAVVVLANAQFDLGSYRQAIETYQVYASLVPASADAHHRIAICYSRLGEPDRAVAEEDAALAIDNRFAESLDLRGGLLAGQGRFAEAIRDLRAAVDVEPFNAPFRVGLARVLVSARQLDDAESELRRALELQPANPDAHAARAALLAARGRADDAVAEYRRALTLRPDADDVRLDLARTLDALHRPTDARAEYARLARSPDTPTDIRREARARLR